MSYDFQSVEQKWQERWNERGDDTTPSDPKRKFYCLEMFAYPSGDIHMGHFRNYSVGDVVARLRRMQGFDVLHPFGWDAFGLPAEEAAIKRGIHPRDWTLDNIRVSRSTLKKCGISYDWDREVTTCLPDYYRWNQWLFLLLYERGLCYRKSALVNWCPGCQTVLANEQVEGGLCWKCESTVIKRELEQWFVKTTAYADRLLDGLDRLDRWPENIRSIQRNWIGRSEGASIQFKAKHVEHTFEVFTTRPDTLCGVSFLAIAPEHPWARMLVAGGDSEEAVNAYIEKALLRTEIERTSTVRVQDGVDTGAKAIHPLTGEEIPIFVADYVLAHYGTGVVMGVPAHDERDFAFARRYDLPLRVVIQPEGSDTVPDADSMEEAYTGEGTMVNSDPFTGRDSVSGRKAVGLYLRTHGQGGPHVNFRLRDWLISRQRYWGTPIPMVHCTDCGVVPVPKDQLPVLLPEGIENYQPEGRSPLADVKEFMDTECPDCGGAAQRDPDTMDTFIDSSWYHLRYADPKNDRELFRRSEGVKWQPIDLYIGGPEHATGHLIYFRFITMVLHDAGLLDHDEPATRLYNHGMVLDGDGKKMSKSKGNLVSPIEMLERYGVDASRVAMCFFAPSDEPIVWKEQGVAGALRFLKKSESLVSKAADCVRAAGDTVVDESAEIARNLKEGRRLVHEALLNMTRAVETGLAFNTVVSDLMKALNVLEDVDQPEEGTADAAAFADAVRVFVRVLAPMAPHLGEELHESLGGEGSVFAGGWPEINRKAMARDEVTYPVQVNSKVRDRLTVAADTPKPELEDKAKALAGVQPYLEGKTIRKVIVVPGKIINLVVG
ncbi:MAG: leucine--tRNA ligase [Planctomycetota bacterium]